MTRFPIGAAAVLATQAEAFLALRKLVSRRLQVQLS